MAGFERLPDLFPPLPGPRQVIEMHVDLVQISCGFAVQIMDFREERRTLRSWGEKKGPGKIVDYWDEKNRKSIDGFDTNII